MKKYSFFALLLVLLFGLMPQYVSGQGSADACPGWHNPRSFVTGNPQYFYSGKKIDENNTHGTEIGVGPSHYNSVSVIQAASLATTTVSTGSYCSPDGGTHVSSPTNRFMVITSNGNDANTGNATPFFPPYLDHEGRPYSSSIRVGPEYTCGSEVLYYQMWVQPTNALLTLWYAPVVQTPTSHDQYENSALIIRVSVERNGQWVLADNSFQYIVSGQPANAGYPQGLVDGENGWHYRYVDGYADIWYKDWTKAMISLSDFLYQNVRIEVYMSACVYDAHFAYCYIAGDAQPMEVTSSGCPAGESEVVDTLRAPENMASYTWYKTTTGRNLTGNIYSIKYLDSLSDGTLRTTLDGDTIRWTRVSPFASTNREYCVSSGDFNPTEGPNRGTTVGYQTFMCKMFSYIDPAKPFASYVYQPVANNKPQLHIDTSLSCSGSTTLYNNSISPNMGLDPDKTKWYVYDNPEAQGNPLQVLYGDTATLTASQAGFYYARLWTCTEGDSTCYTEKTYPIRVVKDPANVNIGVIPSDEPCIGDEIQLVDSTFLGPNADTQYSLWSRFWTIDGTTVRGDAGNPLQSYPYTFFEQDTVTLVTRNGLHYQSRSDVSDTVWCADTAHRVIKVFSSPSLTVSDDTIVCKGNETNVTVSADVEGNVSYEWFESMNATGAPISSGATLRVTPPNNVDRKTYYVKVTRLPQGCVAWDSITVRIIKPTIHQSKETICLGDTVTLWGEDAHHYSWAAAPGDSTLTPSQSEQQRILVKPSRNTTYTLIGHGSDDCSAAPLTADVKVLPYPVPKVSLSPSFIDSEDPTVIFTDESEGSTASQWTFGLAPMSGKQVEFKFEDLSSDSVMVSLVSANSLGCSSDTAFFVPVQRFSTWIPNIFTPNKEENKVFALRTGNVLEFFSIYIFDRRGAQVFYSDDQNFIWDGTVNGEKCPQGTYVYICRYRRPGTSDLIMRKGTVTILR